MIRISQPRVKNRPLLLRRAMRTSKLYIAPKSWSQAFWDKSERRRIHHSPKVVGALKALMHELHKQENVR